MKNVTVRLSEEKVDELDDEADELDMSRAEYIRSLIDSRNESDEVEDELARLRDELERTRQRAERLERANLLILEERERATELEVFVSEEKRRKEAGRLKSFWNDLTGWD